MAVIKNTGSFRDPSGFVYTQKGKIFRQVNTYYKKEYDKLMNSGLYTELTDKSLLVKHKEVSQPGAGKGAYKTIQPEKIGFISYPYEWSFSQLKDAALLTLEVQKLALEKGMILKDASAYNIQFIGKRPVFIDTLSFTKYEVGNPWEGYKQFCEHFIAPLALAHYHGASIIQDLRNH